jgi:hypothetical protein
LALGTRPPKLSSQGDIDGDIYADIDTDIDDDIDGHIDIEGILSLTMCSCVPLCPYN